VPPLPGVRKCPLPPVRKCPDRRVSFESFSKPVSPLSPDVPGSIGSEPLK